ncbi:ATP-binding mismatch repair protein [Rhodotorula kratochvilovae]
MSIQAIDRTSVHRLTSGQVVTDLQTAVKELVENALDAGATSIDITFRDSGVESIEVKDNGKGIDQSDWEGIALKHHTSKLASFADLAAVQTLGFRGEALSSLCGVATLSMITSTAATAPMGTTLAFSHAGECTPQRKVARERGTTVKVERLFEALPVRRKELVKNAQRELGKVLALIQAYAIVNSGVRFEVRNVTKGKTLAQLKTTASTSLRTSFSYIFAPKDLASLLDLDLTLDVMTEKSVMKRFEGGAESSTSIRVKGLISKPSMGHGRTASNRQFYYINGRPFQPPKIAKAVNEVYKSFNANQFPTVVADFQLAPDAYDVNVSPDKRTIFLHSEGNLLAALKQALSRFFDPEQARFEMKEIGPARKGSMKGKERAVEEELTDEDEQEEEDERPRKRRKSSEAPALSSPSSSQHPADGEMDVDLDTSALIHASSAARSSSPPAASASADAAALLAAFPTLPDEQIVLPDPPSPLKRAHAPSSTAATPPPQPRSRSPSTALPLDSGHAPSSLLFRRASATPRPLSPSPAPATAGHGPDDGGGAEEEEERSPSPAPAPAPPLPKKLRQPTLSFLAGAAAGVAAGGIKGRGGGKGKGGGSGKGQKDMRGHLRRFLRGSQVVDDGEMEEDEEGAEAEDQEEEGEERDAEVDELEEPAADAGDDDDDDEVMIVDDSVVDQLDDGAAAAASDDDAVLVVEDSFRAAPASPGEPDVATQSVDLVAASCVCVHGSQKDEDGDDDVLEISEPAPAPPAKPASAPSSARLPFGAAPAEVAGTVVAADTDLTFDFATLSAAWTSSSSAEAGPSFPRARSPAAVDDELAGAAVGEREDAAEATLSRVVSKDDFLQMEVVGQFNLGFIIARRRVRASASAKGKERAVDENEGETGETHDDLFIVDQHASDEKYNFEKLQAETVIQSQRLLAPRILNLPSADELTAMEHVDLLRVNGYDVLVDEDADVGERVKLIAQPVSKDTVFDAGDFEELVDLIGSRSGNEVVRPSKARRMFASRACRKSVMIGKALNVKQMTQILRHMSGMDQPWACPHGRPTMRWLASMAAPAAPDSRFDLAQLCMAYE